MGTMASYSDRIADNCVMFIEHTNNTPTMQFMTGIPGKTRVKIFYRLFAERAWEFQNKAL